MHLAKKKIHKIYFYQALDSRLGFSFYTLFNSDLHCHFLMILTYRKFKEKLS